MKKAIIVIGLLLIMLVVYLFGIALPQQNCSDLYIVQTLGVVGLLLGVFLGVIVFGYLLARYNLRKERSMPLLAITTVGGLVLCVASSLIGVSLLFATGFAGFGCP